MKQVHMVLFSVAAGVIATLIQGYSFGVENQIEQLPIIFRALDSSYLANDFMINSGSVFGPRFFFVQSIAALSHIIPLPVVYLLLTFLANMAIAFITALFAKELFRKSTIVWFLSAAIVLSIDSIQLGSATQIVSSMLTPQLLAMPFALLAVWQGAKGKYIQSSLFAGVSSLFQPLVGLETGALVLAASGLSQVITRNKLRNSFTFALIFFAPFVLLWTVSGLSQTEMTTSEFIESFAYFRAPHHYLPSSWLMKDYIELISFLTAFAISWYFWKKTADAAKFIFFIVIGILIFCLGGFLFVEIIPTRLFIILQPFRMFFLLKWLGLILISGFIVSLLERKRTERAFILLAGALSPITMGVTFITQFFGGIIGSFSYLFIIAYFILFSPPQPRSIAIFIFLLVFVFLMLHGRKATFMVSLMIGLTLVLAIILFAFRTNSPLDRLKPIITLSDQVGEDVEVAQFAKAYTEENAIFLTPPLFGKFRLIAKRAIVVDFKVDPFKDVARIEWQKRLHDAYGKGNLLQLEKNYYKIDDSQLLGLKKQYDISYAVLYRETLTSFPLMYENSVYKLIKL